MHIKKYIGDRDFYKRILAISLPIMIQSLVTSLVNVLDNVMVGRLGTEAMSGVSIVNQFFFVYNLLIFGAISGAGIFTAQYHGNGDSDGVRNTFRLKLIICAVASVIAAGVMYFFRDGLINLYLHDSDSSGDIALTLASGKEYLTVMIFGLLPFALSSGYASTLRETGKTVVPMLSSVAAVVTNCVFNYFLIFGKCGFPMLGCVGAAYATVLSRFVELLILVIYTHATPKANVFAVGAFRSLRVPKDLLASVAKKGMPLMMNEFFWSLAQTTRNQFYSTRGLDAVAAQNIASTVTNLFAVGYLSLSTGLAILIGNHLGAGEIERAKDEAKKAQVFTVFVAVVMALMLLVASPFLPHLYKTGDSIRSLATFMMIVFVFCMPFYSYANSSYYIIRSGGKVWMTILFDSGYSWAVLIPVSFILARFTPMSIELLYICSQGVDAVKAFLGYFILKKFNWAHKLVS